jgi:hypothetical protein
VNYIKGQTSSFLEVEALGIAPVTQGLAMNKPNSGLSNMRNYSVPRLTSFSHLRTLNTNPLVNIYTHVPDCDTSMTYSLVNIYMHVPDCNTSTTYSLAIAEPLDAID